MRTVSVKDAQSHLKQMLDQALTGDDIVIALDPDHAVRLVPVKPAETMWKMASNEAIAAFDDRELNHYLG